MKSSFDGFNNIRLVADEFGDRNNAERSVLFAHGGGQTRHAWQSSAKLLAEQGMHAISLDLVRHKLLHCFELGCKINLKL